MARNRACLGTSVDEPTWVYYAYCSHGGLLYVGIARDVRTRVEQHRGSKKWWRDEVASMVATVYPSRRQALDVEAHAIRTFRPSHNIAGQASIEALPHEVAPHQASSMSFLNARGIA